MQTHETVGNNAAFRLFLMVFTAIVIFLIFGWFAWWGGPEARRNTVVVPDNRPSTTIVNPSKGTTTIVPPPTGR